MDGHKKKAWKIDRLECKSDLHILSQPLIVKSDDLFCISILCSFKENCIFWIFQITKLYRPMVLKEVSNIDYFEDGLI